MAEPRGTPHRRGKRITSGEHECPAAACTTKVPYRQLACSLHWFALPYPLRHRISGLWQRGEMLEYLKARNEAVVLLGGTPMTIPEELTGSAPVEAEAAPDPEPEADGAYTVDPADLSSRQVEDRLRDVIGWARAQAAKNRTTNPVQGRAAAMIATHAEDALRVLRLPVP